MFSSWSSNFIFFGHDCHFLVVAMIKRKICKKGARWHTRGEILTKRFKNSIRQVVRLLHYSLQDLYLAATADYEDDICSARRTLSNRLWSLKSMMGIDTPTRGSHRLDSI